MKVENVGKLLQSERTRAGFSHEERAGLWKGIELSVGSVVDGAAAPARQAPSGAGPAQAMNALGTVKLGALLALAALGGAGIGAAAQARWGEPRIVVAEQGAAPPLAAAAVSTAPASAKAADVPPSPASPPTASPPPASPPAPSAVATSRGASRVVAAEAASPRDPGLARERTLLDMARTALTRGDTSAALAAVDAHGREFPRSQLTEEREVLAIQALAAANRAAEARQRASAFRTSFPRSALLPIVNESTQ